MRELRRIFPKDLKFAFMRPILPKVGAAAFLLSPWVRRVTYCKSVACGTEFFIGGLAGLGISFRDNHIWFFNLFFFLSTHK